MSRREDIQRGSLAEKLAGYRPEPPASVWEGVSSQVQKGRSRRLFFILLSTAAGLMLAITVGVKFIFPGGNVDVATLTEQGSKEVVEQGSLEERVVEIVNELELEGQEEKVFVAEQALRDIHGKAQDLKILERIEGNAKSNAEDNLKNNAENNAGSNVEDNAEDNAGSNVEDNLKDNAVSNAESTEEGSGEKEGMSVEEAEEIMEELREESNGEIEQANNGAEEDRSMGEEGQGSKGRWQVGAALAPQYSYRDVASPDVMQNAMVNSAESGKITYSTGLQMSYLANDRLTIETGVFYNQMGVNIGDYSVFGFLDGWKELDMVYAPDPRNDKLISISNSIGTVVPKDNSLYLNSYGGTGLANDYHLMIPESMSVNGERVDYFSQTFEYLEIPLNIRYKVYDKALVIQLIGGVSTNFLVRNSLDAVTYDDNVNIGKVEDVRLINYSGNAGLGFLYDLFGNLTVSVEPRFRYYLHSINSAQLPSTRPYAFGLQTGVSYCF